MTGFRPLHLVAVAAIAAVAAALYLPFLHNPLIFDDKVFFSGLRFAYYATHPLGLDVRVPPYFTITFTEVLWSGMIWVQRSVGLALHVAVALALYKLLLDLQRAALPAQPELDLSLRAAIGAAAFALHPVAVYGAGYLVQRTIVMATLFGLLSAILFLRGLRRGSHADALSAALLFSLAVLSKEHVVLLPAAVALLAVFAQAGRRFTLRHVTIYFAACAPAAILVTLLSLRYIGVAYEESAAAVSAQVAGETGSSPGENAHAISAVTQAGLFFRYLGLWLWPDPSGMSIDLRVDFAAAWSPAWIAAKAAAFAGAGVFGAALLARRGAVGIAGFGLLWAWILYLVEFSTVRLQEPFVLYRSYLWGPGVICIAVAVLARLPKPAAWAAGAAACALLALGAHGRLVTFSDPVRLWEDAVAKLPDRPVPLGSRPFYQLGREYLIAGEPVKAIATTERCAHLYPEEVHCPYARGAIHLYLEQYGPARDHLLRAIELKPKEGVLYHRLGIALEGLGQAVEARAAYRRSLELGYGGARLELERMDRGEPRKRK